MIWARPVADVVGLVRSERVTRRLRALTHVLALLLAGLLWSSVSAPPADAAGMSFTTLQPGFTQSLYGTDSQFFGGVAFAPNGDPLVDFCGSGGGSLDRFDSTTTLPPVNGTASLHPVSMETSGAGCGLTNDPNGFLYSNTQSGVVKLDANTGTLVGGPFGSAGNVLGIAVDPQTNDLVYVETDGTLGQVDPGLSTSSTFSTAVQGDFIDQIAFDPSGNFLFVSNRTANALTIIKRDGTLVQTIPLANGSGPDGISFHILPPQFVLSNDNDGTLQRFDFPGNDYTQTPTQSLLASGGFRGDNSQVGGDGCLYVTQDGTRYDDSTVDSSKNSLVQICPGFASPPGTGGPGGACVGKGARDAGQMVTNHEAHYDQWDIHYGISKCEGLAITGVSLGPRLMAERMSLPYLELQTCTPGASGTVSTCSPPTVRHITLQPSATENTGAFTQVQLLNLQVSGTQITADGSQAKEEIPPTTGLCTGGDSFYCHHLSISAQYRVFLTPNGLGGDYLDVTQKYEFYHEFSEAQHRNIACEPSQQTLFPGNLIVEPLNCARWKPLVFYQYHPASGASPLLKSLTAAERLHFIPDSFALRAETLARDCDHGRAPDTGCLRPSDVTPFGGIPTFIYNPRVLELYPPWVASNPFNLYLPQAGENPIRRAVIIRGVYTTGGGPLPGRYDNIHLTTASQVGLPLPIPPGCPECVHMHWRWGYDVAGGAQGPQIFGYGMPLLRDAEPGAQPSESDQTLDVGIVPYHSEDLTPSNFENLFPGTNPAALHMTGSDANHFTGGITTGRETLDYPSGSCFDAAHPASWGQCGQVVWLSATTQTFGSHDEDSDTFFAFGGFFCSTCADKSKNSEAYAWSPRTYHSSGSNFRIDIGTVTPNTPTDVFDVLPPAVSNVTTQVAAIARGQVSCGVSIGSAGEQIVHCRWTPYARTPCVGPTPGPNPDPRQPSPPTSAPCITISGTAAPGTYNNLIHVAWGGTNDDTAQDNGGNYRTVDSFTVG